MHLYSGYEIERMPYVAGQSLQPRTKIGLRHYLGYPKVYFSTLSGEGREGPRAWPLKCPLISLP